MKTLFNIFFLTIFISLFYSGKLQAQTSLKSQDSIKKDDKDLVYTKVETEASFPGGDAAWKNYITDYIQGSDIKSNKSGTCVVRFIVDKDGNINEAEAITMQGSAFAKTAINAIKDSPKWIPAQQNGIPVKAWRIQPITVKSKKKRYFATGLSSNYVSVVDVKKNTVPRAYRKILLFGAGNSLVRLVIDKLDEQLAAELKNKRIESNYYFLGNDKDDALEKSEQILKAEKCDAIMVFMQVADSYIKETTLIEGLPIREIKGRQTVAVQLFDANDKEHSIWEATISMNFNLTSDKAYKKIFDQILKNMYENLILN
jgi:protein TonB